MEESENTSSGDKHRKACEYKVKNIAQLKQHNVGTKASRAMKTKVTLPF